MTKKITPITISVKPSTAIPSPIHGGIVAPEIYMTIPIKVSDRETLYSTDLTFAFTSIKTTHSD